MVGRILSFGALALGALVASALVACGTSSEPSRFNPLSDAGVDASGGGGDSGGLFPTDDAGSFGPPSEGGSGEDAGCGHDIQATIRDFRPKKDVGGHPDFENDSFLSDVSTPGLVKSDLGADHTPVYLSPGSPAQLTGPTEFAQWYHDVPGVNMTFKVTLTLTESPAGSGTFVYQNDAFFPIDGQGFGNGPPVNGVAIHNFAFSTEVHSSFTYHGGEVFSFRGDDDLWVFINNKMAIDLGGLHPKLDGSANLDAMASTLGITKGGHYALDIFHAERHTDASHFNLTTTIGCLVPVVPK
jgi:fibro-slime domain-containing protein